MNIRNDPNKVRITQTELNDFPRESMKIDPFWEDLYNSPPKNRETSNRYQKQRNRIH